MCTGNRCKRGKWGRRRGRESKCLYAQMHTYFQGFVLFVFTCGCVKECRLVCVCKFPLPFGIKVERPALEENFTLSFSYVVVNFQAGMTSHSFCCHLPFCRTLLPLESSYCTTFPIMPLDKNTASANWECGLFGASQLQWCFLVGMGTSTLRKSVARTHSLFVFGKQIMEHSWPVDTSNGNGPTANYTLQTQHLKYQHCRY